MTYEEIYQQWLANRKLTHPEPSQSDYRDRMLEVVQVLVIVGSMALSGTRVGTTLAQVGVFKSFGATFLPDSSPVLGVFTILEWVFAFLTVEAAIFLAGYLTGDDSKTNVSWYWGLLFAALGTSIFANLYPMFTIIGGEWQTRALIVVSIITGLCTSIMPFIGGRVLSVTKAQRLNSYRQAVQDWTVEIQRSWRQSGEYKQWRKGTKAKTQTAPVKIDGQKIVIWLEQQPGPVSLDVMAAELKTEPSFLMAQLRDDPRFSLEGFKVKLNGNS